jgi:hypothetical protein
LVYKDEEVRSQDAKKKEDHQIFANFGMKKFIVKKTSQKKTLVFEHYNLVHPMEQGALIF